MIFPIILFSITFLSGCYERVNHEGEFDYEEVKDRFFYDIRKPDVQHDLTIELEEISGLAYLDDNTLAAVQDELGHLYYLNISNGEVRNEIKFAVEGDFEGVENVGDTLYAVKSNGKIYKFPTSEEDQDAELFENPLNIQNNIEGLGYWPQKKLLLLACKEDQELSSRVKKKKDKKKNEKDDLNLYGFDIEKDTLLLEPVIKVGWNDIESEFKKHYEGEFKGRHFSTSAIAYHPRENNFYLLSSAARMLMVINTKGKVQGLYPLDRDVLRQPEGICFAPDGTMYISSEGRGGVAYFVQYNYRR